MHRPAALIFDFDGVLLESEFEGNRQLAALLTDLGHRHTVEETLRNYVGLSGKDFIAAIEERIGTELPPEFHEQMKEKSRPTHLEPDDPQRLFEYICRWYRTSQPDYSS